MISWRRLRSVAAVGAAAYALIGCGDSAPSSGPEPAAVSQPILATSQSATVSTTTAAPVTTVTVAAPLPDACTLVTADDVTKALGSGFVRRSVAGCSYDKGAYDDKASGAYRLFVSTYNGVGSFPYRNGFGSDWTTLSGLALKASEFVGTGTNYLTILVTEHRGQNWLEVKVFGVDSRVSAAAIEDLARIAISRIPS